MAEFYAQENGSMMGNESLSITSPSAGHTAGEVPTGWEWFPSAAEMEAAFSAAPPPPPANDPFAGQPAAAADPAPLSLTLGGGARRAAVADPWQPRPNQLGGEGGPSAYFPTHPPALGGWDSYIGAPEPTMGGLGMPGGGPGQHEGPRNSARLRTTTRRGPFGGGPRRVTAEPSAPESRAGAGRANMGNRKPSAPPRAPGAVVKTSAAGTTKRAKPIPFDELTAEEQRSRVNHNKAERTYRDKIKAGIYTLLHRVPEDVMAEVIGPDYKTASKAATKNMAIELGTRYIDKLEAERKKLREDMAAVEAQRNLYWTHIQNAMAQGFVFPGLLPVPQTPVLPGAGSMLQTPPLSAGGALSQTPPLSDGSDAGALSQTAPLSEGEPLPQVGALPVGGALPEGSPLPEGFALALPDGGALPPEEAYGGPALDFGI